RTPDAAICCRRPKVVSSDDSTTRAPGPRHTVTLHVLPSSQRHPPAAAIVSWPSVGGRVESAGGAVAEVVSSGEGRSSALPPQATRSRAHSWKRRIVVLREIRDTRYEI